MYLQPHTPHHTPTPAKHAPHPHHKPGSHKQEKHPGHHDHHKPVAHHKSHKPTPHHKKHESASVEALPRRPEDWSSVLRAVAEFTLPEASDLPAPQVGSAPGGVLRRRLPA